MQSSCFNKSVGLALCCLVACLLLIICQLVYVSAREQDIDKIEWWKKTSFYHIYIRSFKDSDGDGEGDIRGITEKLDYLKSIGVGTVLMSPFYSSPMKDCGYDIDDYIGIQPNFGTMQDFENLTAGLSARGMHMVVDFVPNHSSDQHAWFKCSERALFDPACAKYKDYYIWSNKTDFENTYPNNWVPTFVDQSAWKWSPIRQEFFYHQFLEEQPDLNLRNPAVREEFKEIARFWFRKGVHGLRVDAIPHFVEDEQLRDEPINPEWQPGWHHYDRLLHIYTKSLPECPSLMQDWHDVCQEPEFKDAKRVIISESYDSIPTQMEYYGPNSTQRWADMPFNFDFSLIRKHTATPQDATNILTNWLTAIRDLGWPNENGARSPWAIWVSGNHDQMRLTNRVGEENHDAIKMISYMAPGVPVDFYGDELGMRHSKLEEIPERTLKEGEPSRLAYRPPMSWTAKDPLTAGFSESKSPWMSVSENYRTNNVETLLSAEGKNNLKNFIQLGQLRRDNIEIFVFGDLVLFPNRKWKQSSIFAMARTHEHFGNLLLLVNFDDNCSEQVYLHAAKSMYSGSLVKPPRYARVLMVNYETETFNKPNEDRVREGIELDLEDLSLGPHQAILLKY